MNCPYDELQVLERFCELCHALRGAIRDLTLTIDAFQETEVQRVILLDWKTL